MPTLPAGAGNHRGPRGTQWRAFWGDWVGSANDLQGFVPRLSNFTSENLLEQNDQKC